MSARRRARLGMTVVLAVAGLAACADDDGPDAATTEPPSAEPPSAEPPATEPPAPAPLAIEMSDYSFGDLPASVPSGTPLAVTNVSEAELHEVVAFRLPDDEERSAADIVGAGPEQVEQLLSGLEPATVVLAAPGGDPIVAVGDGTLTEPGRYLLVCVVPTGADPAEYLEAAATSDGPPDVPGGPPHIAHGMWAELRVEDASG